MNKICFTIAAVSLGLYFLAWFCGDQGMYPSFARHQDIFPKLASFFFVLGLVFHFFFKTEDYLFKKTGSSCRVCGKTIAQDKTICRKCAKELEG